MKLTPQITFRGISSSAALDAALHKHISKLETFYDRIINCRVMIETSHRHRQGNLYRIRIDLTVPGGELVVNRSSTEHQEHEDIYVAIRDAFHAAERELKDYAQRQRGEVKIHEVSPHRRDTFLSADSNYELIEPVDKKEH